MAAGPGYNGRSIIVDEFMKIGNYQVSHRISVFGNRVEMSKLLQVDYSPVHKEDLVLTVEQATAAARAILKHFGEDP